MAQNIIAYNSATRLDLPSVPKVADQATFNALVDLHNAIAALAVAMDAPFDGSLLTTVEENSGAIAVIQGQITAIESSISTIETQLAALAFTKYTAITSTPYIITDAELIPGHNIFGVNVAGAVEIIIPDSIASTKIIVINDESGNAGSNNITIRVAT